MIISCIIDTEKRAAARFAQLRKHPFFKNSCCQQKMCFNCKVASYHRGISCASKLRAESAIGVHIHRTIAMFV